MSLGSFKREQCIFFMDFHVGGGGKKEKCTQLCIPTTLITGSGICALKDVFSGQKT